MTYAAVPALRHAPELDARFSGLLAAPVYQPGLAPPDGKAGLLAGMAMTEKQGGSDVRVQHDGRAARAVRGRYLLRAHRPQVVQLRADVRPVPRPRTGGADRGQGGAIAGKAAPPTGPTCFLLPRVLPDGSLNGLRIQRLKDKLGNRSNASAEVEYDGALAWRVGEPGRGIRTIIDMVSATRLDCVIGSAAAMRQGAVAAVHHATHRTAFGKMLVDQPLMASVLADLVIEAEAAAVLGMRLAGAADRAARGDRTESSAAQDRTPRRQILGLQAGGGARGRGT